MTEREYLSRIEALQKKASEIGAEFEHSFYDKDHLDFFWYHGYSIATVKYKGYTICFDVVGDVRVVLYTNGEYESIFVRRECRPFFENEDCKKAIKTDELLREKTVSGDLGWINNNWISIAVIKEIDDTWEDISEPEVAGESNLLEAVEKNFDYYIAYIDGLLADSNN